MRGEPRESADAGLGGGEATLRLPLARPGLAARPAMTALEHQAWSDAIAARCGLDFGDGRSERLARCLWARAREVGAGSYHEYRRHLAFADRDEAEWEKLVATLVNGETRFFRHVPSFEALAGVALPALAARTPGAPLTLWSAGCSTGEEACSLAMVADALGGAASFRVVGSDLSQAALARAREGRYRLEVAPSIPRPYRRYLTATGGDDAAGCRIEAALAARVSFVQSNLAADFTLPGLPADVIFCQNVLIHFRTDRRLEVVRRLARQLQPGGFLFLAPGEMAGLDLPELLSLGLKEASVYRRV